MVYLVLGVLGYLIALLILIDFIPWIIKRHKGHGELLYVFVIGVGTLSTGCLSVFFESNRAELFFLLSDALIIITTIGLYTWWKIKYKG